MCLKLGAGHYVHDPNWLKEFDQAEEQKKITLALENKISRWEQRFTKHDPDFNHNRKTTWLVEDFLPSKYTILLGSDAKEGKTAFLDALTLAIVKGEDFLGRKTSKGPVLWASMEESPQQREINLMRDQEYNTKPLDIYTAFDMPPLHHEETPEMLEYLCLKYGAKMLVIDPLYGATGFHTLSEGHYVRRCLTGLSELAFMCETSVIIPHQASSHGAMRLADSIQIQATVGMIMYYERRPLEDGSNLITLNCKGRGAFANQQLKLRSTGPLHYEPYDMEGPKLKLRNSKEEQILDAVTHGYGTGEEISQAIGQNLKTTRNLITKLAKEGKLIAEGRNGNQRRYALA